MSLNVQVYLNIFAAATSLVDILNPTVPCGCIQDDQRVDLLFLEIDPA